MKFYGYSELAREADIVVPEALAEVSLVASPAELRAIAGFLVECASEMERMGGTFDHAHLGDRLRAFQASPHFVVAQERTSES